MAPVRVDLRGLEGGEAVVPTLDRTNPEAVLWIREHGAQLVREITEETRLHIRNLVKRSFEEGIPPRELARLIREEIGLTQRMGLAVERRMAKLTLLGLDRDAIAQARERYARRLIRWRAMNIARTETIRASNMGQQFLWRKAADDGLLDRARTKRVWITTPDDRLCPYCASMEGQEVGFEDEFQPTVGANLFPSTLTPPLHPMCRCAIGLRAVPAQVPALRVRRPRRRTITSLPPPEVDIPDRSAFGR